MSDFHVYPRNRGHVLSMDCWCWPYRDPKEPRVVIHRKRPSMSDWWTEGAMVNSGLPGDEGFVGDAATEADAQRIVDAHNEARIQEPAAGPPYYPAVEAAWQAYIKVIDETTEGAPERDVAYAIWLRAGDKAEAPLH